MKTFEIVVRPDVSALLIGGRSAPRHGGDRATARDPDGRLMIPASALRGALRIELERLLKGRDPEARACSANREEHADPDSACECPVCRLFGDAGVAAGRLRLDDAVATGSGVDAAGVDAAEAVVVRPRVAVSRHTRTAAEKLLGFFETGPLLGGEAIAAEFRAAVRFVDLPGDDAETFEQDLGHLRAACAALRGIGGSRARGLGWIDCSIENVVVDVPPPSVGKPPDLAAGGLRLCFEAEAPLHLGLGPPLGYFQPSRRWAPGSAVRGAIAFALLEHQLCGPDDPRFRKLLAADGGVSFGSAVLDGHLASTTRRECRPSGRAAPAGRDAQERPSHVFDDLVAEVIRRRAAERGVSLAVRDQRACPRPGCQAVKAIPADHRQGAGRPQVRVRTRTALNRRTGTAMDAKLFSHEVLEPRLLHRSGETPRPLRLRAELWGLDDELGGLLAQLREREVSLGGKRGQGMGRCRLDLRPAEPVTAAAALAEVEALGAALHRGWEALRTTAGGRLGNLFEAPDQVPLAVVLTEPWCPGETGGELARGLRQGPLTGDGAPLEVLGSLVRIEEEGRFGAIEGRHYGAPSTIQGEVPPVAVVAAGSTYVYALAKELLEARLEEWLALGRNGQGLLRELGWGRFLIRGANPEL
jgi:CRISPR/Cas system CSM-associated protein Csm3 (group 7 of RAMP superfamily)